MKKQASLLHLIERVIQHHKPSEKSAGVKTVVLLNIKRQIYQITAKEKENRTHIHRVLDACKNCVQIMIMSSLASSSLLPKTASAHRRAKNIPKTNVLRNRVHVHSVGLVE